MATSTTSYSFNLPTVGSDVDLWGDYLNSNWEDIDDLLDGTTPVDGIDIDGGTIDGTPIGGTTPAAGDFTALTATGGASGASVNAGADELALHNDGDAGLSILTPNTNTGRIYFGDPESSAAGRIQYSHGINNMIFFTDDTQALRINSVGSVGIKSSGGPTSKLDVAGTVASTEASAGANCAFKAGLGRSADGTSNLDLIGDTTYTDYGLRIIRGSGANATSTLQHRGTGPLRLNAEDTGSIVLRTNGSDRFQVSDSGDIDAIEGSFEVGLNRASDGTARIGLYGAASGATNGDFQIFRASGTNGSVILEQKGTGAFNIRALAATGSTGINLIAGASLNGIKISANGNINFQGLPTSSAGLSSGDLWNDSGTLKIV